MQRALYNSSVGTFPRSVVLLKLAPRLTFTAYKSYFGVKFKSTRPADAESVTPNEQKPVSLANAKAGVEAAEESIEEIEEKTHEAVLLAKLAEKDKALAEMKNHYSQSIANFRNLQQVTAQEVQKAKDFALQKFAKDLLETLDNFSLALGSVDKQALQDNQEVKNLYRGLSMTRDVLEKTLGKYGVEKIDPMGEQFDPHKHEATFEVPQPDKQPGSIFHVQLLGYTLNKRVLRPAKVGLVKDVEN